MRELEETLAIRLVERGQRNFRLTEAGQSFHERTHGLLTEITQAGASLSDPMRTPRGLLRVSAPVLFAHVAMGRIAADFTRAFPEVELHVIAQDRRADPIEEGYDVVIRVNPQPDSLVGRCFIHDETFVVAPTSMPRPDEDGAVIPAVMLDGAKEDPWQINDGQMVSEFRPKACVRSSSLHVIRDAVVAGAGAARLPWSMVAEDVEGGRLACWGRTSDRAVELWVLHTSRRLTSAKVSAFVDFLCATFPDRILRSGSSRPSRQNLL